MKRGPSPVSDPIMQNDETDFPAQEKHSRGSRQAKGCVCLFASIALILFALVIAAIVCIVILDSVSIRGEGYTMERRVERYKVACRFIWEDFKDAVTRWKMKSSSSPVEPEIIQNPADSPEVEPGSEPAP